MIYDLMKRSFYIPRHIVVDKDGIVADSAAANQGSSNALYADKTTFKQGK